MPVHSLLGGAVRSRIKVYGWVGGDRPSDVLAGAAARAEAIRRLMAEAGAAPRLDEIVAAHRADLEAMPDPLKHDLRAFYAQCRRNLVPAAVK